MEYQKFEKALQGLINDKTICKANRDVFEEFFKELEYKLTRQQGLEKVDGNSTATLYNYTYMFRNVNAWFNNKPLKNITEKDIKKVYDDLEENKILNKKKVAFRDKNSYYTKVFKGELFRMLGKDTIAKQVLKYYKRKVNDGASWLPNKKDDVKKIIDAMIQPKHKLLAWLCFDIGENISAMLQLTKECFTRQVNEHDEVEYIVRLDKSILKRSRTPRSEPTFHPETVALLETTLPNIKEGEKVFTMGYFAAKKSFKRATDITKIRTKPDDNVPTFKHLRSTMACYMLDIGFDIPAIQQRLGHAPSSSSQVIDRYISFEAMDRKEPRKKVYTHSVAKLQKELDGFKERERVRILKEGELQRDVDRFTKFMEEYNPSEQARKALNSLTTKP